MTRDFDFKDRLFNGNDVINNSAAAEDTSSENKKKKRSPAMMARIVLLFILIVIMITLALFASTDEVTNVFIGGKVNITLLESKWKPEEAQNIVPETELDKNPQIRNDEKVDVFVFLKVTIPYDTFEIEQNSGSNKGSTIIKNTENIDVPLYKFGIITDDDVLYNTTSDPFAQNVNSGWLLLNDSNIGGKDTTNHTYTYVYAHVGDDKKLMQLIPDATTGNALFDKVKLVNINESYTNNTVKNYNIQVKAYGIQSNYLKENNGTTTDPVEVWNMVKDS